MAINFPSSPVDNEIYTENESSWYYNASAGAWIGRMNLVASGVTVNTFDSSGTWSKPAGYLSTARVHIQAWGGGGSGGRNTTSTSCSGGGGGGYNERWVNLSAMGASETITIGAGGVSRTTTNQDGASGGNSSAGSLITAYGGGAGVGTVASAGGGSGGGQLSAGSLGVASATTSFPGLPYIRTTGSGADLFFFQGSGTKDGSFPAVSIAANWHGGGGGTASATAAVRNGGASLFGGGGGAGHSGGTGGASSFGGNGGASAATGTAGTQPGGGGGSGTSTSGAGAAGRIIITVFP